jgi:tetratricopeptide (TPR) repeat protein
MKATRSFIYNANKDALKDTIMKNEQWCLCRLSPALTYLGLSIAGFWVLFAGLSGQTFIGDAFLSVVGWTKTYSSDFFMPIGACVLSKFFKSSLGLNEFGFRIISLFFHCLNGLLIFKLVAKKAKPLAFLATAIFLFHPMAKEVVFFVQNLGTILSVTFFLLGLLLLDIEDDKGTLKQLIVPLSVLIVLVSGVGIALVASFLMFAKTREDKKLLEMPLLFCAIYFIFGVVDFSNGFHGILSIFSALTVLFKHLIWPFGAYPLLANGEYPFSILGLVSFLIIAVFSLRKKTALKAMFLIDITLGLAIVFALIGAFGHLSMLGSYGYAVLLGLVLWLSTFDMKAKILYPLFIIPAAFLIFGFVQKVPQEIVLWENLPDNYIKSRISLWYGESRDSLVFISRITDKNLSSKVKSQLYSTIGTCWFNVSENNRADDNYRKALRYNPQNYLALGGIAILNGLRGDDSNSINGFKKAILANPEDDNSYYNMGLVYAKLGNYPQARTNIAKAMYIRRKKAYKQALRDLENLQK